MRCELHLRAAAAGSLCWIRRKVGLHAISRQNAAFGHVGEDLARTDRAILESSPRSARRSYPGMLREERVKINPSDCRRRRCEGALDGANLRFLTVSPTPQSETYSKNLNFKKLQIFFLNMQIINNYLVQHPKVSSKVVY